MTRPSSLDAECKRLHTQSVQALKDEFQADKRLQALQKKLKRLRREGQVLQQSSIDKEKAAKKVLEEYTKVVCRKLCVDVYNTFPREVRDMIYGHLHEQQEVHISHGSADWGRTTYFDSTSECQWRNAGWGSPRSKDLWWEASCVGEHMLQELSEHYYHSIIFHFADDFSMLPRFRTTDPWNLGFIPADVVTNIVVSLNCANYNFVGLEKVPVDNNRGWGNDDVAEREACDLLLPKLENLFGFRSGTKMSIKFLVGAAKNGTAVEAQEWMCETVMPLVFPTLRRLETAGYKLRIILHRKDNGWSDDYTTDENFVFEDQNLSLDALCASFVPYKVRARERRQREIDAQEEDDEFADVQEDDSDDEEDESAHEEDE